MIPCKPEDFAVVPKELLEKMIVALNYVMFHAGPGPAMDATQKLIEEIDGFIK